MAKEDIETVERKRAVLGRSPIFTHEVINDIHMKAELGRYRMRGFSMFKPIPHWDQLMFMPGTLTRFVIEGYREKCVTKTVIGGRFAKKPLELDIPIYITGMSFGALSLEAKMALAKGASMAGSATCSGEGGMIPPERDLSTKWFYQCIQSRYGFNPHHLMCADAVEFFIGQGCKVGLGGHLMGQKVTEQVAEMRSLPAGIDQRSPARHPDWMGPDDLSLKIQEVREATDYQIPIQLKLGASRVYDDVRMAAKCGPDVIYLDGAEGGTGAGPHIATEETGTRHRTADRIAKQTGLPVVSVSKSMSVIALYVGSRRYVLEGTPAILSRANQAISTLERFRARLDQVSGNLAAPEVEDLVTVRDVALFTQRLELVRRIRHEIDGFAIELGVDGRHIALQAEELGKQKTVEQLKRKHVLKNLLQH